MIRLDQLFILGLLTTSIHWLIARSEIAKPLWSRARDGIGALLRCAGCTGWWLGIALGIAGLQPFVLHYWWTAIVFSGVFGAILTPIFEGAMLWGLRESAIDEPDVGAVPVEAVDLDETPNTDDTITPLDRP